VVAPLAKQRFCLLGAKVECAAAGTASAAINTHVF
jgi:hypothetical protein